MHHYPFHPGDYLLDTAHLDAEHDLAYRRLLDLYYTSEAPIPLETQRVATRLRVDNRVVSEVLAEFFTESPEGWKQARCDAVIADYHALSDRNRRNGRLGGRPRKPSRLPAGTQREPSGNPLESQPETINHKPMEERDSAREAGEWMNRIRQAYPRQTHQAAALDAIISSIAKGNEPEVILQAVRECAAAVHQADSKGVCRWVPNPERFFTNEQWLDPKVFAAGLKPKTDGNTTTLRRDTGNLNRDDRYAKKP